MSEGKLGRDCPICHHPDMAYQGKSLRPLTVTIENEEIEHLTCEFYRCLVCNHVEWKVID